jgi:hypothetical protein
MSRYRNEIIAVLLIKLILIISIKMIWFSDPPPVNDQAVASRLLSPSGDGDTASPNRVTGKKEHS